MSAIRLERLTGRGCRNSCRSWHGCASRCSRRFPISTTARLDYEERYLRSYAEAADSVVVGAFDGDAVVGADRPAARP